MRQIRILPDAEAEAIEAARWYESHQKGLGADFEAALEAAFDLLEAELVPFTAMPGNAGLRGAKRIKLRRFPYDIVVIQRRDECVILAVAHQSRRPGYWRSRNL